MDIYCVSVMAGKDDRFSESSQKLLAEGGRAVSFKKKLRRAKGEVFEETLFPGYVFLETPCAPDFSLFKKLNGFRRFLPDNKNPRALSGGDLAVARVLLSFGRVVDEAPARFDENDRIVILAGPFSQIPARVVSVNRRSRRLNAQIDFLGGAKVIGLSYREVAKE